MRLIDADQFLIDNAEFACRDTTHPLYEDTVKDLIDAAPTVNRWNILAKPEKWFKGALASNGNLPKKSGLYCVALYGRKGKQEEKMVLNAYYSADSRGHCWELDSCMCNLEDYAVVAWAELPPFPELPKV